MVRTIFIGSFLIAVNFATPVGAITFVVQDPCNAAPWLNVDAAASVGDTIGIATVATLDREHLPYIGNDHGINAINGTPTGDLALEVIGDREMRAYGWCFRVNGHEPGAFANEVTITNNTDNIYWFFGFAHYIDGDWISMCTPTHVLRPAHVCHE